jgi:hypothetical protein
MAKFQCELPTQLINELTKLEENTPKMMEEMTEAGAEVVYKNVIANMSSSFKDSSKLKKYLKITKTYRTKDGSVNTKVGFYGYYKKGSKSFKVTSKKGKEYSYDGIPVPLIVRAREFGSSSGEAKRPFFRKSFNKSQIESEMLKVQKKYIKE